MTNEECIEYLNDIKSDIIIRVYSQYLEALDTAIQALKQRHKGKWIYWTDDYKDYVTCSECEYGAEGEVFLSDKTPFCPVCGADMRESDNE